MNLLTEPLIRYECAAGARTGSLPEVLAALIRDEVDSFPALRPHQMPAWHMFLAQLGAIVLQRAGLLAPPDDAATWGRLIGDLTRAEFPQDEPWCLVVADESKPAFLQPPVPTDRIGSDWWTGVADTPDALDMLLVSRGHELKQAVALPAAADDWLFALVSLQTCEGYNGKSNYGIARMNGGSSSRVCLGLAPLDAASAAGTRIRLGRRLRRDLLQLAARHDEMLAQLPGLFPPEGGEALVWTLRWEEGDVLALTDLDILFIEACRRVRLRREGDRMMASTGTSSKRRIDAEQRKGVLGDPWAPVHKTENKALTLGEEGDFDYARVVELMLGADWQPPLLATLGPDEGSDAANWQLVAEALARGNSKTGGFRQRVIPLTGRVAKGLRNRREELHVFAKQQIDEIKQIDGFLRNAIALGAAGGDNDNIDEDCYARSRPARRRLKDAADRLFFPALWQRFEAVEANDEAARQAARSAFVRALAAAAETLLEEAIADLPCPSIRRPRAEVRARRRFYGALYGANGYPECFPERAKRDEEEVSDDQPAA
jgi:CRISPR system Cascade subunit CasA